MTQGWIIGDREILLQQLLHEAEKHDVACILLSNGFEDKHGRFDILAGFGAEKEYLEPADLTADSELCLGFIAYDLKNKFELLRSQNPAAIEVPDFYFFKPQHFFKLQRNKNIIETNVEDNFQPIAEENFPLNYSTNWKCLTNKRDYIQNIIQIKEQIENGDFYELNYCLQFEADNTKNFDPVKAFIKLNKTAPAPFAALFKYHGSWLLCSSPERFITRKNNVVFSQPIKGTRKRSKNSEEDNSLILDLQNSEKDRAENTMITDLVRNDLSRFCVNGSVVVNELCKVYSFSHVHQMISEICGTVKPGVDFNTILQATFPMGSMTGTPKIKVMETIDRYENFKRGWYSGSVGWFENGNFDLNVVIRSLQFSQEKQKLIYNVGGAIVYDSLPEQEYEECLVKAAGIISALN
jgi:para-aminobenzoate synthetase component 1